MTDYSDYVFSEIEISQRRMLCKKIEEQGYRNTIEEIAYTWFNRFIALRFMEVNGYLPSHVRVFSDDDDKFNPQIINESINLDFVDTELVYNLRENNKNEQLYRYLLITQCNELSKILPGMFQQINDYTELLLPDYLLRDESVLKAMVELIPQEDWTEQVQILGWLYQYYNSEPKDKVFADLKKNVKISKENIPAATQLFTPDWIVRYMVENSLGRLWAEGHTLSESILPQSATLTAPSERESNNASLFEGGGTPNGVTEGESTGVWKYYLPEAEQSDEVKAQLTTIRSSLANSTPEDIKCIDPCMGSGHILCYMFDVLVQIYEDYGYSAREAAEKILTHNLYGLDIDERAAQLAYFAVMMKARQYDRRFFAHDKAKVQPHVFAVKESNFLDKNAIEQLTANDEKAQTAINSLILQMKDAKIYGSLIQIQPVDFEYLYQKIEEHSVSIFDLKEISDFVQSAQMLSMKYDVVVTNPPYMGGSGMNAQLSEFIKKNFADYKSDLFSAFIVRCTQMAKPSGYLGFLSPYVWMFIQSYEKMRNYIYSQKTIETLIQFEYSAFEEATVPICTFVLKNSKVNKNGCYLRLTDFRGGMEVQRQKTLEALADHNCGFYYEANQENFSKIPGSPVAYWVGENVLQLFANTKKIDDVSYPRQGIATGNNDRFLRLWYEVSRADIKFNSTSLDNFFESNCKYIPHNKGGSFRKWFANMEYIIRFDKEHYAILGTVGNRLPSRDFYFRKSITWSKVTSGGLSMRYIPDGSVFDSAGCSIFCDNNLMYMLGFVNSCVMQFLMNVLTQTLNYEVGSVKSIPIVYKKIEDVEKIVEENIGISKQDLISYETHFEFERHPLI
jgi:hypothetical protein